MPDKPTPPPPPPNQHPPYPPRQPEQANAIDALLPTNPMAAIACYMGILSIVVCFCGILLGPGAIVLGWLGLKTGGINETSYGKTTSNIRAWVGIVTGIIGTLIGLLVLLAFLLPQIADAISP